MEDVPQPSREPYDEGDEVRIYLAEDDVDGHLHATSEVVVDRFTDSLGEQTGRELDSYSYRLRARNGELLDVEFRHRDLDPTDE